MIAMRIWGNRQNLAQRNNNSELLCMKVSLIHPNGTTFYSANAK